MVSISKRTEPCCICGKEGKYGVFKKYYCEEHYKQRPKGKSKGFSSGGLIALSKEEIKAELSKEYPYDDIHLINIPKGNKIFATLYLTHYPNSKGIVGRSINYLVIYKKHIAGIIGATNPPYAMNALDEFFGITKENRIEKNRRITNNHVFRLIDNEHNLASRCLRVFRNVVTKDWYEKYGDELEGMMTFVEPPRSGSCYRADNWTYLGMTKGRGCIQRSGRWESREWVDKAQKHIFAKKLKKRKV